MNIILAPLKQYGAVAGNLEEVGCDGQAVRARVGREAYDINVGGFCCGGLNFGYFYERSPVIAYDGEALPGYTIDEFRQSTVPGCHTPHLWLRHGGHSTTHWVLTSRCCVSIRRSRSAPSLRLQPAGAPMTRLDMEADEAGALYPHKLLLSRPDQHVAWRGNKLPDNPIALIDQVRGASAST